MRSFPKDERNQLTHRECEVLSLVLRAKRNKEISDVLVISEATVINHLHSIYRKLGVKSRTEAAIYALSNGLENVKQEK